jgi:prepilin-type N-terminal cleavage/methylation domain-containing protein
MIHSKNRSGFTLIETLLAIAVASIILIPLYNVLATVVRSVTVTDRALDRLMQAELFLQETTRGLASDVREFLVEKIIDYPAMKLRYELKPAPAHLHCDEAVCEARVLIVWQEGMQKREEKIVTFLYRPIQEKEKKA